MLSMSEGGRVSWKIRLRGSRSDGSAFNADGGAEKGVYDGHGQEDLGINPKTMERAQVAYEQLKAMVEGSDLQMHMKLLADQIDALLTLPAVQEQANDIVVQVKAM